MSELNLQSKTYGTYYNGIAVKIYTEEDTIVMLEMTVINNGVQELPYRPPDYIRFVRALGYISREHSLTEEEYTEFFSEITKIRPSNFKNSFIPSKLSRKLSS